MAKEMIECSNCGKLIEKKVNRTMCIKCTNVWNKIQAEKRRATQEYKEYYKEYTKNHKRKGRLD
jgi:Zn finger protein HypA/HybF involved in hydrogenase expression